MVHNTNRENTSHPWLYKSYRRSRNKHKSVHHTNLKENDSHNFLINVLAFAYNCQAWLWSLSTSAPGGGRVTGVSMLNHVEHPRKQISTYPQKFSRVIFLFPLHKIQKVSGCLLTLAFCSLLNVCSHLRSHKSVCHELKLMRQHQDATDYACRRTMSVLEFE